MADLKITQLVDGGVPQATDEFVIARAGDNFKVDFASLDQATLNQAVILAPASSARNVIQPTAGAVIAAIVKAHAAQSVDIFRVENSAGGGYVRVGATGAVGLGAGTYDPALYGGYLTQLVLSRASDGYYDANGGPPIAPGTNTLVAQTFIDGEFAPTVDQTLAAYQMGASWRATGVNDFGLLIGYYQEALHFGTKVSGSGSQGSVNGFQALATSETSSTGDLGFIRGGSMTANHAGSGVIGDIEGMVASARLISTASLTGTIITVPVTARVSALSGGAVPVLTGIKVDVFSDGRAVTLAKGIDIPNVGRHANVVTSYGLYMAAQSGSTNPYGIYVAGGKSVFIDGLEIGHDSDTTLARSSAGNLTVEGNLLYRAGGTDVPVADGGTGSSTAAGARTNLDVPSNAEAILDSIVDAKGDLIAGTAADTVARLATGTDFLDVLTPDSSAASGLRWGKPRSALSRSGALFETIPRITGNFASIGGLASKQVTMQAIDLPAGLSLASISFMSATTALSVGVHQYFGLYNSSRVLLRGSVDDTSTAWAANTVKTLALTSAFVTTYSGLHYLAILVDATTVPTVFGLAQNTTVVGLAPILAGLSTSAVTALPDPAGAITAFGALVYASVN